LRLISVLQACFLISPLCSSYFQWSLIIVITRHYNFYFPICQRTYLL